MPARHRHLLHRVAQADAAATDELWERYRPALRRMIGLRLDQAVSRRVDASDVVQDVLIKASQRLAEYLRNPVLPFHLWLRQIARDHVIDAHRRHRASARRSVDREQGLHAHGQLEHRLMIVPHSIWPHNCVTRGSLQRPRRYGASFSLDFTRCFFDMDEGDREIILLRHFEQLSNGETAQALGLSEAAAGMRHLRALRRLRASWGKSFIVRLKESLSLHDNSHGSA